MRSARRGMNEIVNKMAKDFCLVKANCNDVCNPADCCQALKYAEKAYEEGYRKQSEGEWIFDFTFGGDDFYECSVCGRQEVLNELCEERNPAKHFPYCHCGAKMKGGAE